MERADETAKKPHVAVWPRVRPPAIAPFVALTAAEAIISSTNAAVTCMTYLTSFGNIAARYAATPLALFSIIYHMCLLSR